MTRPLLATALTVAFVLAACGGKSAPDPADPGDGTGPADVGTSLPEPSAELIAKGASVFEDSCSICHGDVGEGSSKTPALKGADALGKFSSDGELLTYTRKEMPKDDPGSLSDDDYIAVIVWMRAN